MNNKHINFSFLNLRIIFLIIGSFVFLGLSFLVLFNQRTNTSGNLEYSNIYMLQYL